MHELSLIAEKDVDRAIFRLYEEGIYHVEVKKGQLITMDFIHAGYQFLDDNGGGRYYNIYEFGSFSDVDPKVREWMAAPPIRSYTIADAIVINSLPLKMLADFYLKFDKPVNPTRVFNSRDRALDWILELKLLEDQCAK
jgi:hypothetical protein